MTMPADRERDRRSLQDLAKMALTPPPPSASGASIPPAALSGPLSQRPLSIAPPPSANTASKDDDSGIIDLAAASMADPSAALRAQGTALASQGLFDDDPQSVRPPPATTAPLSVPGMPAPPNSVGNLAQPYPSMPPASAIPASIAPQSAAPQSAAAPAFAAQSSQNLAAPSSQKKGGGVVIALAAVVALGAVAAGGFFFMRSQKAAAPVAVTAPEAPPAATTAAPAPTQTVAAAEPTPAPVEAAPADTTDPNALPAAGNKLAAKPAFKGGPAPKVAAAPAHEAKPAAAEKNEPAKLTEKDLAPQASGPAGELGDAMGKAVGGGSGKPTPAAATTGGDAPVGNVPQKPSQGAVTGAVGAVLPGARGCLGPDDPISRASIVFGSNGQPQSVNVSGGAAGKPAEACIKGALMKAKLPPFAEATYTANITVRHN